VSCESGHCITCSDEGIEMTVLALRGDTALCRDPAGAREEIDVALVGPIAAGDVVLAHARVAIAHLREAAA
jgi:hydrogenase maturation factor